MLNIGICEPQDTVAVTDSNFSSTNWTSYAEKINRALKEKGYFEDFFPEEFDGIADEILFFIRRAKWEAILTPAGNPPRVLTIRYKAPTLQVMFPEETPAVATPGTTVTAAANHEEEGIKAEEAIDTNGEADSVPTDCSIDLGAPLQLLHTCLGGGLPCQACAQGEPCIGSFEVTPRSDGPLTVSTTTTTGISSDGGIAPQAGPTALTATVVNRLTERDGGLILGTLEADLPGAADLQLVAERDHQPAIQETSGVPYTVIAGALTTLLILLMGAAVVLVAHYL